MFFDLHVHTEYSPDSSAKIKDIVRFARKRGLRGIAITDHDTIKGAINAKKEHSSDSFEVIVGEEITSKEGYHVIGLYLQEEIEGKKYSAANIAEKIRGQGGVSILPHPYRARHGYFTSIPVDYAQMEKELRNFDLIEVFNPRSKPGENKNALLLRDSFKISQVASSDAHLYFCVGDGVTKLTGDDAREALVHGKTRPFDGTTEHGSALSKAVSGASKLGFVSDLARPVYRFFKGKLKENKVYSPREV